MGKTICGNTETKHLILDSWAKAMKEIGGYFEFERSYRYEYHQHCLRINTGRNAVLYAIKKRDYQKIFIPHYICQSIVGVLTKNNIPFQFYPLNHSLEPLLKTVDRADCVLFVNYFGQYDNQQIKMFANRFKNIIVDNTHAFFQLPVKDIDTVYTCRKFFGVPDGAYLYFHGLQQENSLEQGQSYNNMAHLLGRFETSAEKYYSVYRAHEEYLDAQPVRKMSALTQNLLKSFDYKLIQRIRKDNFKTLHKHLSRVNNMAINHQAGLFMYPLLIPNGSAVKMELIKNKIYVPTLWPNVLETAEKSSIEYYFSDNLVLLPIDQRYGKEEMQYILNMLKELKVF